MHFTDLFISVTQPQAWAALAGGIGLLLGLRFVMPVHGYSRLRLPAAFLAGYLACALVRSLLPVTSVSRAPLGHLAIGLLLLAYARAAFIWVVDYFLDRRLHRPIPKILKDIIQGLVYFAVALVTFRAMGAELGSLLTTSALLTAVIGLSLQETLGNLFAGLAIQAERPFSVGDWIQFGEDQMEGRVLEINWRATKIVTNDQVEVTVPNGTLAKVPIRNFTTPTHVSRRNVTVQGPYEVPPERVLAALHEAVTGAEGVLRSPPPEVWTDGYGDSGIDYRVLFFIDDFSMRYQTESAVRRRIWYSLARAGISVPFPIRDVRVSQIDAEAMKAQEDRAADERLASLKRVDFMEPLPERTLKELARQTSTRLYATNELVIRQGDEGDEMFIVQQGEAAVLLGDLADEVAQLGPGSMFGEMSLMTGERRNATVQATTELTLLVVAKDLFREFLADNPRLLERVTSVLARRRSALAERSKTLTPSQMPASNNERALLERVRRFFAL